MNKIYAPVTNGNFPRDREGMVKQLRRLGVSEYVFVGTGMRADCGGEAALAGIKENCDYLHKEGFKACVWKWSWHMGAGEFNKLVSADGVPHATLVCPSDEAFVEYTCDFIRKLTAIGPDMILFDDDFSCFGYYGKPLSCFCEKHLRLVSEKVGEQVTHEFLKEKLLSGGANRYRSAWIEVNAELLRSYARKVRQAVDEVNPACRIGICCSPSAWDYSADISELAHIMAGNTKPYLRLIGAPYWAAAKQFGGFRMQDVIEHERCIANYCDGDIEIMAEGDTYPRPRFRCPASYVEALHMATLADGRMDGILKYGVDFSSRATYETGYVDLYEHNLPTYKAIEECFTGKENRGIYVLEAARKFENLEIPDKIKGGKPLSTFLFGRSGPMLAVNAIPTAYQYNGYGTIAFGESAKYAAQEVLDGGMILDIFAAKNLEDMGIDVGLRSVGQCVGVTKEFFVEEDDYVGTVRGYGETWATDSEGYRAELKDGVKVLTRFVTGGQEIPGSYLYENANGQRFMVFLFDGFFCGEGMFRMYSRGRQIKNNLKWLCGKELPAFCGNNPELYMLCKEADGKTAVGLWNFAQDPVLRPKIELNREYTKIRCINCEGRLEGNKVYLSKLYSNEFAGFEVE